jgi:hypothetical protein
MTRKPKPPAPANPAPPNPRSPAAQLAKPPIPADHHRNRIKTRSGDGKFKRPPNSDSTGYPDPADAGESITPDSFTDACGEDGSE